MYAIVHFRNLESINLAVDKRVFCAQDFRFLQRLIADIRCLPETYFDDRWVNINKRYGMRQALPLLATLMSVSNKSSSTDPPHSATPTTTTTTPPKLHSLTLGGINWSILRMLQTRSATSFQSLTALRTLNLRLECVGPLEVEYCTLRPILSALQNLQALSIVYLRSSHDDNTQARPLEVFLPGLIFPHLSAVDVRGITFSEAQLRDFVALHRDSLTRLTLSMPQLAGSGTTTWKQYMRGLIDGAQAEANRCDAAGSGSGRQREMWGVHDVLEMATCVDFEELRFDEDSGLNTDQHNANPFAGANVQWFSREGTVVATWRPRSTATTTR